MKYKHSRQELRTWFHINIGFDTIAEKHFQKMLLAQKEDNTWSRENDTKERRVFVPKKDKKECKHKFSSKDCRCFYCGEEITSGTGGTSGTFTRIERPTPSPLEIEEMKEIDYMEHDLNPNKKTFDQDAQNWFSDLEEKVNQLIRNQKKLYQFIKEKL